MNRKCIPSYAFLDLETTGLPELENNKTKITEICLVAVSKDTILDTDKNELPRVLNKLSFCVNPSKQISSESTRITGLDNFMLEKENKFDENFAKLLIHYLLQLPQPVCLVAHNGYRFDFPIIQKQLKALNMTLPDDTLCVDSLVFFRSYEEYLQQEKLDEPKPLPDERAGESESRQIVTGSVKRSLNSNETVSKCSDVQVSSSTETQLPTIAIITTGVIQPSSSTDLPQPDIVDINEVLSAEDVKEKQKINESTPSDRKTLMKKELFPKRLASNSCNSVTPPAKRGLFTSQNGNVCGGLSKRMKFTLSAVHERFFGQEPNKSHYAENDVLALIKCVIASKLEFTEYAAENATLFKDIKPL